ncbi:MAG: hypothetical protein IJL89_06595, partial [Firmicutes bacterium]|nr:hypothetical protein [Bacillota bacterium]
MYEFEGSVWDENVVLDTTARFMLDDNDISCVNANYTPEEAGKAYFSGYFVSADKLTGEHKFTITDSNNNAYSKNVTMPETSRHKGKFYIRAGSNTSDIATVSYIDGSGKERTAECKKMSDLSEKTSWDATYMPDGWIVVDEDTDIDDRVLVNGAINLVLSDGVTLNAKLGITVPDGCELNIYAQQDGTGTLNADSKSFVSNYYIYRRAAIGAHAYYHDSKKEEDYTCGTIRIYGGNIKAVTTSDESAGIGGANNWQNGGTILISGGNVTAVGGNYGAGIGGAYMGSGGNITINGGTVTATGGYNGSGIGGGSGGSGESVTITGGNVTATGGGNGAGIGSGGDTTDKNNNSVITITGGTVNATGTDNGAAIGGGLNDNGGRITISGGNVTATGGGNNIGIGYGKDGKKAEISLSWTNVGDSIYSDDYNDYSFITLEKTFMYNGDKEARRTVIDGETIYPAYKVEFNSSGGEMGYMSSVCKEPNSVFVVPESTLTPNYGEEFDAWALNSQSGDLYHPGDEIVLEDDIVFYPIWKSLPVFNLETATISGLQDTYIIDRGETAVPDYTVKDSDGNTLKKGTDYTETIKKNGEAVSAVTEAGRYTLEISGTGHYSGTAAKEFRVMFDL